MKILHLNDHLAHSGGIETYLLSLLPELEARGHESIVGFGSGDEQLVPGSRQLPWLSRSEASARREGSRQIAQMLREISPDVVHVHNIHNTGVLDACLDSVPTVLHGHDYRYLCPASSFYHRRTSGICQRTCGPACFAITLTGRCLSLRPPQVWTYYRRVRHIAACAGRFARVIANSGYTRDRFLQAGFPPDKVVVAPYHCPIEPLKSPREAPRQSTILFVGRARRSKGYRDFIEALAPLPGTVKGILVGDFCGETGTEAVDLARRLHCEDRLEIRPWMARDAARSTYALASIVVVPSVWAEPLGIVGLEAMACGVPVVASDVGGVREWLINGRTGRLVPPKDPQALARAIQEILDLPDQGRRMGEEGQALVRARFSRSAHLDQLTDVYATACRSALSPVAV